ncbi:MAG: hypothetical protein OXC08_16415 [Thiotrichales bacterium]|nr:hypothetical protein [Thiotrichales bacterium]
MSEDLAHDSEEWRDVRNRLLAGWVRDPDAVRWLLDLWDAFEVVDDLIDKDKPVSDERILRMLWEFAVDCPTNPFFLRHAHTLAPVLHLGVNHWIDANDLEREGTDASLRFSYILRAAYMSITQTVVELTRGREAMRECSLDIIRFFGTETYEEYAAKIRDSSCTGESTED